jgi:uncharacterized membrane protein YphA (DoxX/SURF4 family)
MAGERDSARLLDLLVQIVALALITGMALSSRLWTSARIYPTVPVLRLPQSPTLTLELLALAVLVLFAAALIVRPRATYVFAVVAALTLLCLLDQSRMQPWVQQYAALLVCLGLGLWRGAETTVQRAALDACRLVLVATYFWSGMQKLNPGFRDDVLPWFTGPLQGWTHVHEVALFGYLLPFVEILAGLCLLLPTARRFAVLVIVGMHAFVLLMLGPLGNNWNAVVWPWNIAQAVAVVLLFAGAATRPKNVIVPRSLAHATVILVFGILPALSFFGLWDSYASMALYSGNIAKGYLLCDRTAAARLKAMGAYFRSSSVSTLDIYAWSFEELKVPPYPEPRIYIGVARGLCRKLGTTEGVELQIVTRPMLAEPSTVVRVSPGLLR